MHSLPIGVSAKLLSGDLILGARELKMFGRASMAAWSPLNLLQGKSDLDSRKRVSRLEGRLLFAYQLIIKARGLGSRHKRLPGRQPK
jgi:hypothetical protein